jgi:eukaryotic-like serine/threonine-protein kinase
MPFGTRVWSAGKLLLLGGALLATFLVFFGVSMRLAVIAGQVQVPDLTGRTINDAQRILKELGLELRDDPSRRPDERIPAGHVMRQEPSPGEEARPGRTVRVWISSGPRTTKVPALVDQAERSARFRIEQDGLEIASISEFRSPDYLPDSVVAQIPPPSSTSPHVSLLVNRSEGSQTYVMPDVIGMPGEQVEAVLRGHGFRVTTVGSQPYAGVPPGTVVRQEPRAGYQVGPADPISLEVSR